MNIRRLATISLLFVAVSAQGATILDPADALVTDQQYRDLGASYSSVGQVSGPVFSGSGTYIGGRWVLTAGHIAFAKSSGTFTLGESIYSIVRSITYPGWSFGSDFNDIGLIELSSEISSVPPASMISLSDDSILLGQETTWVGYGQGGTGRTGSTGSPGTLRGFTNIIDGLGPLLGLVETSMLSDFDSPDGAHNALESSDPFPTLFEGNVAPGDSGGGVFWQGGLVGVTSYRARLNDDPSSNSDYGEISGASRLGLFTNWITEQTTITSVPEPSAALMLAGALLGLTLQRRRRS